MTANLQSVPPTTTDGLGIDYFRRHLVYRSSPAERAFEKELDALFRRELGEADFSKDAVREALGAFAIGNGYQAADPVAFGAQRRLEAIRDQLGGAQ